MNRLSKILLMFVMGMGLISPVIGSVGMVAGQDDPPPCKHGSLVFYNYVPSATFSHRAPCGWLVKFPEKGAWKLTGTVDFNIFKAFHYPACSVTKKLRVKATPGCAIVIYGEGVAGSSYRFTLTRVSP